MSGNDLSQAAADGPHRSEESLALLRGLQERGVTRSVVLMRHSARQFDPSLHDLENPLTERGRRIAAGFGQSLDSNTRIRAYASPPARCVETANLIREQHAGRGGEGRPVRVVEGLGVFYILDQIRMWKGMTQDQGGMAGYMQRWFDGECGPDELMPPGLAAVVVLRIMFGKLMQQSDQPAMDICISHDTTLLLVREKLLNLPLREHGAVDFLDSIVLYQDSEKFFLTSRWGGPVEVHLPLEFP
jgi:hypothetical protein